MPTALIIGGSVAGTRVALDLRRLGFTGEITIADDGVGFPPAADPPWTIASHVAETGGRLSFRTRGLHGAAAGDAAARRPGKS